MGLVRAQQAHPARHNLPETMIEPANRHRGWLSSSLQVLGHTKTVLVLLTSWLLLHEHMSLRKALGMALAVTGMVAYGYLNSSSGSSSSSSSSEKVHLEKGCTETLPLLSRSGKSAEDLPTVLSTSLKSLSVEKRLTAVPSAGSLAPGALAHITVVAR